MLSDGDCMRAVAEKLKQYKLNNVVIDPVMYAKNGCPLMQRQAIETLIKNIIPLAGVLTPNIPEAEIISNRKICSENDMKHAAEKIFSLGSKSVLIKGGHRMGNAVDILFDGNRFHRYETRRINTKNTHGTGCTLSSAIASNLALGKEMSVAVKNAKDYITTAIRHSLDLGKGCGPTNHFYELYKKAGLLCETEN